MNIGKAIKEGLHASDKILTGRGHGAASKFFKYAYPFNGLYLARKGWNSLKKNFMPSPANSAGSYLASGGDAVYGSSGSIVGRY